MLGPFFLLASLCLLAGIRFFLVLALGSGVGTAPDLGNHFLLRQKVIKNRFFNTHGGTPFAPLALRSDSRRESEFLWGSALRFARASYFVFGAFVVLCPLLIFGLLRILGFLSLVFKRDQRSEQSPGTGPPNDEMGF